MRLRPVFILSEGFCRAHGLPHKRVLRPPLFKKAAEVVNYSKLAIRYTTSMTKDMMYGALREIFRGVRTRLSFLASRRKMVHRPYFNQSPMITR